MVSARLLNVVGPFVLPAGHHIDMHFQRFYYPTAKCRSPWISIIPNLWTGLECIILYEIQMKRPDKVIHRWWGMRISNILGYISPAHAGRVTKTVCMYYVSFNKCLVISRLIKALFSSPSKTLQINYIKVWTYTWHIKCSRKKLIFTDCLKISRRIFWA